MTIIELEEHYVLMELELFSGKEMSSGHESYLVENMRDIWPQLSKGAKDRALERAKTRS